jgi:hypothetical protein
MVIGFLARPFHALAHRRGRVSVGGNRGAEHYQKTRVRRNPGAAARAWHPRSILKPDNEMAGRWGRGPAGAARITIRSGGGV